MGSIRCTTFVLVVALGVVVAFALPEKAKQSVATLVMPPDAVERGALCIDGSPAGYYFRPGFGTGQDSWIIHFQGGAWCYDDEWCLRRASTVRGSSLEWEPTFPVGGIMSDNPAINPDFFNWNMAFFRYCDGSSFSGDRQEPLVVNGQELYFRGLAITDSNINDMLTRQAVAAPSRMIVSGCSAGALATSLQLEHIRDLLPPSTSVVGLLDGGYFIDVQPLESAPTTTYYGDLIENLYEFQEWNVNQDCVEALGEDDAWRCLFSPVVQEFIDTPTFLYHSPYDVWQLDCHLGLNCRPFSDCNAQQTLGMHQFYAQFLQQVAPLSNNPENGYFLDSCFTHCQLLTDGWWAQSPVLGQTAAQTFGNWYFSRNDGERSLFDCGYPNEQCGSLCFSPDQGANCDLD